MRQEGCRAGEHRTISHRKADTTARDCAPIWEPATLPLAGAHRSARAPLAPPRPPAPPSPYPSSVHGHPPLIQPAGHSERATHQVALQLPRRQVGEGGLGAEGDAGFCGEGAS